MTREEWDKQQLLKKMGLTKHEDLGLIDGKYYDEAWRDNKSIIIYVDSYIIDKAENPLLARLENLKKAIKRSFKGVSLGGQVI